jgi:prepilin-type processing-associated H-X9-DG protein
MPTDGVSYGWAYTLANTIVKSDQVFQCPSDRDRDAFTDYWMNAQLLGLSESRIRQPANVTLSGDGLASAADYVVGDSTSVLPIEAWDSGADYAVRHLGTSNFLFTDGHAKALKPDQVTITAPATSSNFSFTPE